MLDLAQGSPEWFAARLGKVTASRVADVIAKTKTGYSASRANYAAQIIAERLTGEVAATFTNDAMRWGTECEPDARTAYEFYHDVEVVQVGFMAHPTISMAGASPDGLVGDVGGLEIKCPNTATHIEWLLGGTIPAKHLAQIDWQLACSPERQWWDFASFDPRLPEDMRLFVCRRERDNARIAELEAEVSAFLAEVDERIAALKAAVKAEREAA